jgi:hypothetical protein
MKKIILVLCVVSILGCVSQGAISLRQQSADYSSDQGGEQ